MCLLGPTLFGAELKYLYVNLIFKKYNGVDKTS